MKVTVFRQVPPLIIGTCGVAPNRDFDEFEQRLDALEATGVMVERFDPSQAADEVAARPSVQRLIAAQGNQSFPVTLVDDEVIASGRYPSRTEWAHAIGRRKRAEAAMAH